MTKEAVEKPFFNGCSDDPVIRLVMLRYGSFLHEGSIYLSLFPLITLLEDFEIFVLKTLTP